MKKEKISEAIGNISEKYIEEAANYKAPMKTPLIKWFSLAACLCLIFVGGIIGLLGKEGDPNSSSRDPSDEIYKGSSSNCTVFSVGYEDLQLEIYDCYTIPNEADVISVRISSPKKNGTVYFRSSDKIEGQAIRRIESLTAEQTVKYTDGIFSVDLTDGQEFSFLNIFFDAGTFKKSIHANNFIAIYFECAANSAIGNYEKIVFSCDLSEIRDKAN